MSKTTLHIVNDSSITDDLTKFKFEGDILTWHEMLCEGPTLKEINTPAFFKLRKKFLERVYNVEYDVEKIKNEFDKLKDTSKYSEIVLWFEYNLFCHINLIAAICLIKQKNIKLPLFLVCSGRVEGEKELKSLGKINRKTIIYSL
ncbi:DUF1835 domain-containing protein [Lacinutrix neustonica]|uniref:DUF1835 domain-containing protein n=1 Tax=Lacinutrix neustonica TaxID=2980107 RepID=A0A9E8SDK5_9FLAO|nr:DUF1835 domain-containing protein [Lacinutrix neustonica]WAC02538.1 DUF1835 domain-containing protein [Lacinutrix neustonica]